MVLGKRFQTVPDVFLRTPEGTEVFALRFSAKGDSIRYQVRCGVRG
jgi:hypothetical protein